MRQALERGVIAQLYADAGVAGRLPALESAVAGGELPPEEAAGELLGLFHASAPD